MSQESWERRMQAAPHLRGEKVIEQGGHDGRRLLLGHADVPAQLNCALQAPRARVPARRKCSAIMACDTATAEVSLTFPSHQFSHFHSPSCSSTHGSYLIVQNVRE